MKLWTSVQKFALVFGIVYALVGVLGFVPGLLQAPPADAPALMLGTSYGSLLGIFPVNAVHNLVHIIVGLIGIVAARGLSSARGYSRSVAIIFGVLTIMGLVPGLSTTLGYIPIFGADVVLHAVTMLAAAYFGWFAGDARVARANPVGARI
jgi:hypothetical protein